MIIISYEFSYIVIIFFQFLRIQCLQKARKTHNTSRPYSSTVYTTIRYFNTTSLQWFNISAINRIAPS